MALNLTKEQLQTLHTKLADEVERLDKANINPKNPIHGACPISLDEAIALRDAVKSELKQKGVEVTARVGT